MGREENVTVFQDTEKLCKNNKQIAESIRKSIAGQKLIPESEKMEHPRLDLYAEAAAYWFPKNEHLKLPRPIRGGELLKKIENGEKVVLYHGSKGGIVGDIEPESRPRCDYGEGFYMGTSSEQAKGMVISSESPVLYTVEFDFSKIPPESILVLDGLDWLFTVLAFRKQSNEFSALKMADEYVENVKSYNVVIGAIADDIINEVVREFSEYSFTDKVLGASLAAIDHGYQIVAKTKRACEAIKIISAKNISGKEVNDIQRYMEQQRKKTHGILMDMVKKYLRDGLYLFEIIEKEKEREKKDG